MSNFTLEEAEERIKKLESTAAMAFQVNPILSSLEMTLSNMQTEIDQIKDTLEKLQMQVNIQANRISES